MENKNILFDWSNKKGSLFAAAGVCLLLLYAFGCQPKTRSLVDPGRKVDRAELLSELEILKLQYSNREADLDKQEEIRNIILQQSFKIASGGDINPLGLITSALAVFGAGASVDNVRLRRKAKNDSQDKKIDNA